MDDETRTPTSAELKILENYTASLYNPTKGTAGINDLNIEKIGFSPVVTGTRLIQANETGEMVFQNMPWDKKGSKRLQIFRKATPEGVEIYAETEISMPHISDDEKSLVGSSDSGSYFFGKGLVIGWATKPVKE